MASVRLSLITAFLVAISIRVFLSGFTELSHDAACFYLPNAQGLLERGWSAELTIAVPPLFPWLVSVVARAAGSIEWSALVLSVLASGALVFSTHATALRFFPGRSRLALWSAWLAAVQPLAIRFAADARADALYALVFSLAILVALSLRERPTPRAGAAFGGLVGVGYLLRPEALGLLGLLALWWAVRIRSQSRVWRGRCALAFSVALLLVTPAIYWNMSFVHERIGIWTLSPKAGLLLDYDKLGLENPLTALNERGDMTLQEEKLRDPSAYVEFGLWELFREHPGALMLSIVSNLGQFALHLVEALGYALFPLLLFGFVRARRADGNTALWLTLSTVVVFALAFSLFYVSRRFWLPFIPLLLPWVAHGISELKARRWLVVTMFTLTLLQTFQPQELHEWRWRASSAQLLGERALERYGSQHVYVSAKGKVAWYAKGKHLALPDATLGEIRHYMSQRGAHFLVIDARRMRRREPHLMSDIERIPSLEQVDTEGDLVLLRTR